MSTLDHAEGDGSSFAAALISKFDIDIVQHAIYGGFYIHR